MVERVAVLLGTAQFRLKIKQSCRDFELLSRERSSHEPFLCRPIGRRFPKCRLLAEIEGLG